MCRGWRQQEQKDSKRVRSIITCIIKRNSVTNRGRSIMRGIVTNRGRSIKRVIREMKRMIR